MRTSGADLYKLGINYFGYGNLKQGRYLVGYWFKCDTITQEQKNRLLSQNQYVEFLSSGCQYAPEIKKPVILVLSEAEIKRRKLRA